MVLLEGPLGAGKTTFVRGALAALGHTGPVKSPTFSLMQEHDTVPPVLHADLYRVASAAGLGLEDYLVSHLCLIEWPDRLGSLASPQAWRIEIAFADGDSRRLTITPPP